MLGLFIVAFVVGFVGGYIVSAALGVASDVDERMGDG
jgi:hypothetical protein